MSSTIIFHYFDTLSAKQREQFEKIGPIYERWNAKLNLVSRKDMQHIYLKHVLHALSIAKVISFEPNTQVLDVGTGGGFPGIPLAIMFPQVRFYLVDSIGKKVCAVQHITEELGLANVSTQQIRAEDIEGKYDFILGRAVTNLVSFYGWVRNNIACYNRHSIPNGILYLKGEEPIQISVPYSTYAIRDFFNELFFETKQLVHLIHDKQ
jgi:16S rRNA (guanine527-N7)-methyltransferase